MIQTKDYGRFGLSTTDSYALRDYGRIDLTNLTDTNVIEDTE